MQQQQTTHGEAAASKDPVHSSAAAEAHDSKSARAGGVISGVHAPPPAPASGGAAATASHTPPHPQSATTGAGDSAADSKEWFAGIAPIRFDPAAPPTALCFRHYNAEEKVMGKSMAEWLKFSVCYWHSFGGTGADPFGAATIKRPWDDGTQTLENYKRRMRAAFEFFTKLGVKWWTFHDRDIAPEGKDWDETQHNLREMVALAKQLMAKTGVRLLWGTANLFAHPRYMNGSATNPDVAVFAHAAAQVKAAMHATHELGGVAYVFWSGRDGYQSLLTKDVERDAQHYAQLLRMAVQYKAKIGFAGQLLIEPKPKEPLKHQYDYDAQTVMGFLHRFGLTEHFKLNIEPNHTMLAGHAYEHDIELSAKAGMLGSIDANTGDPSLGWDTDQFPGDLKQAVLVMKAVLECGGLPNGGLNFDAKVRRESIAESDLFAGHISAMDLFARALKAAAVLIANPTFKAIIPTRYASYATDFGRAIESGKCTFDDCEQFVARTGEPKPTSGEQEKAERLLNAIAYDCK